MIRAPRLLACALVAAAFAATPAAADELPPSQRHVLSVGHADIIDVRSEGGTLVGRTKDDSGEEPVIREPGEVLLHAKPESQVTVPPGFPEYAFLGDPGDPVWILPEVEDPNLLWPGWSTEELSFEQFPGASLTLRLLDLRGPGEFSVFVSDPVGQPIVFFDSARAVPQEIEISNQLHQHVNWAFEAQGLYVMTVEVIGTRADGAQVSTGPIDYHWFVGDVANLPADVPATTLTVAGLRSSYARGEQVTLTAVQTPDTGRTDVRWAVRCPGATTWTPAGAGAQLTFSAALGLHGCAYRAQLRTEHGTLHATSEPVLLSVQEASPPAGNPPIGTAPPSGNPSGQLRARVSVRASARRLRHVRRAGAIPVRCTLDGRGRCAVRASIDGQMARRLGVAKRRVTIGRGSATTAGAATTTVRVRLTRKGRAALRRVRGRLPVRLSIRATGPEHEPFSTRVRILLKR
jgi:surface-anchored protein